MDTISVAEARRVEAVGKQVRLQGWVRTRRDSKGGFSFLELNDGSCQGNVQVIADGDAAQLRERDQAPARRLQRHHRGRGARRRPPRARRPKCRPPASPSTAGPTRRRIRCRRRGTRSSSCAPSPTCGRAPTPSAPIARVRNCVCQSIHDFFQEQGFLYVHTPIITASDCEGAGEMFRVTTLDLAKLPRSERRASTTRKDFFDRPTYLTVSGQLEAEIFACALGKVYTFGPTFRAENSNTSRHLAEFWMVEPEMAFYELHRQHGPGRGVPQAHLPRRAGAAAPRTCSSSTSASTRRCIDTLEGIVSSQFLRVPYTEAVDILTKSGQTFEFPVDWGIDLQSEHERYPDREALQEPGDPVRLSADDQAVLHARQRRRQDGAGDGRAGARRRRDHRRQPARGAARRARSAHEGAEARPGRRTGGISTCGATARCRTPASAWAWSGRCSSSPAWRNIRDVIPFPRTPGSAEY